MTAPRRPGFQKICPVPIRRVALVYSPILSGAPMLSSLEKVQRRPGLGLRYLKAVLMQSGIEVDLYDNLYDQRAARVVHRDLNSSRYDLVGFHCTSISRELVMRAISKLHRPWYRGRVLVGGPGSVHARELLGSGADLVIHEEGEETIRQAVAAYRGERAFETIQGISYLDTGGQPARTPAAPLLDLATLPFPNWDDYDGQQGDMFNISMKRPFFVVMASRGCPHRCGFCACNLQWRQVYRSRPVKNVLDEVQWLVRDRGARYIHFLDDVFGHTPGWVDQFCDELERRRLQVDFSVVLHPLSFQHRRREVLTRLCGLGCKLISYGAQSADPQVLKKIHRSPQEVTALREALGLTNELGVATVLTYIFGLPGDTEASIRRAIDFVNQVRPTLVDFHPLLYLPGSEIADSMPPDQYSKLDHRSLNRWSLRASVEYYLLNGGLARLLAYVVRNNPGWFLDLTIVRHAVAEHLYMWWDRRGTKLYQ